MPARLDDGTVIYVEVRRPRGAEQDVAGLDLDFKGVEDAIRSVSARVWEALKAVEPHRATVEFGMDLSVGAGGLTGLLAKASGSATLTVTLEWSSGDA